MPRNTYRKFARRMTGVSVSPWLAIDDVIAWTMYWMSFSPASTMAWQSASKRLTFSVMLSSTRKIARAPRDRASEMSARTREKSNVWKFRPRISMIEQKLQSYVQPRDVSTMSTWRPSSV